MDQKKRISGFIVKLLVIGFILAVSPAFALAAQQVVVNANSVNIRSGPGTTYNVTGYAGHGDKLALLEKSGQWYKVKMPNGSAGWIAGWLVSVQGSASVTQPVNTPAPGELQAVVNGSTLNVRTGPGTGHQIAGQLKKGAVLRVLDKSGDWYKVALPGGGTGWVAGWLVTTKSVAAVQPAPQNQTAPKAPSGGSLQAEVTGNAVNIRSGPGTGYKATGKLNKGARLAVLDKSGEWYKLQTQAGPGWVYGGLLKISSLVSQPPASNPSAPPLSNSGDRLAVINGSQVNIRSGPGTSYSVMTQAKAGEKLPLIGQSAEWYKVQLSGGKIGWVASWLTKIESAQPPGGQVSPGPSDSPDVGTPAGGVVPPQQNQGSQTQTGSSGSTPENNDGTSDNEQPTTGSNDGDEEGSSPEAPVNMEIALKSLSVGEGERGTEVTVESRVPMQKISAFKLGNPERLVVDLEGVQPGDLPETISAGTRLVSQVRVGWYNKDPDTVRLVFDLKGVCYHTTLLSQDKKSLSLELFPPGPGRPLAGSTVVLDPGHGGSDPGAVGRTGLREKDVNLDVARRVAEYLRNQGANVLITREDDIYVGLEQRPAVANSAGASLFLSIHMNANPSSSYGGTSTYYLRPAAAEGNEYLQAESRALSLYVQQRLVGDLGLRNIGVLQANFAVLRYSKVPAALVEVAFISNSQEEALMKTESFKQNAARAIARGIADYFAGGKTDSIQ